jgi:uncharacterized protein
MASPERKSCALVSDSFEECMGFEASTSLAGAASALQASIIYSALLVLLGVALSIPVMLRRRAARIGLGDGGDKELLRRMRVHANFIEQAALGLPVILLLPLAGAPALVVHLCAASMLAGRLLHAQGLFTSYGTSFGRAAGMLLTWTALLGGSLCLVIYAMTTGTVLRLLAAA